VSETVCPRPCVRDRVSVTVCPRPCARGRVSEAVGPRRWVRDRQLLSDPASNPILQFYRFCRKAPVYLTMADGEPQRPGKGATSWPIPWVHEGNNRHWTRMKMREHAYSRENMKPKNRENMKPQQIVSETVCPRPSVRDRVSETVCLRPCVRDQKT